MKLIERSYYLNKLQAVKDTPDIKVITGLRRSGKSKLLDAYANILERETTNNVIRIPLHLKKYEKLRNGNNLYEYIDSKYCENSNNYLLIDEIQMCQNFEETINSLHEEERFDIYLTGSNAFLLSSDLATLFRGRVFQIDIYPFSFNEYLLYYPNSDIDNAFDNYVHEGGMAGSYLYKDQVSYQHQALANYNHQP